MHRELTVLENITFSGQTRLPADWTQEMKRKRDGVLERMKWSASTSVVWKSPSASGAPDNSSLSHLGER